MGKIMGDIMMLKVNSPEYLRMEKEEKRRIKRERKVLQFFSREEEPVVVSLNDQQGLCVGPKLNRLSYVGQIVRSLDDEGAKTISHNLSSNLFNKTYHVRMFLDNNITMQENERLQIHGTVEACKRALEDAGFPSFLGNVGYLSHLFYRVKKSDKYIRVADSIKDAEHPLILYSSGSSDLLRIIGTTPKKLKRDLNPKMGSSVGYLGLVEDAKSFESREKVSDGIVNVRGNIAKWEENLEEINRAAWGSSWRLR